MSQAMSDQDERVARGRVPVRPDAVAPEIARLQGIALAAVFQIIISEAGNRTRKGQSQAKIADELYPIIGEMVDELDRWFQASESSSRSKADGRRKRR